MRFSWLATFAAFLIIPPALAGDRDLSSSEAQSIVVAQASSDDAQKYAFESAKELGTVEAWDAFLSNYPDGFYADLARAYVKKLAESPTQDAPQPPQSQQPPVSTYAETVHYGPGSSDWQNTTRSFVANSSRPAYAAIVDAGGVEMTAFCHTDRAGPHVVAGLRATGADPGILGRLRQGLASAPAVTQDLASVAMTFSDGTSVGGVAATTPPQDSQVTLYVNRKLLEPDGDVIERLMAGQSVTVTAPPFAATFQLDGSRSALCKMVNACGAKVDGCEDDSPPRSCGRGKYRDDRGRCVAEQDGQDGNINCGRGRTWVGAQGKCVCVNDNAYWNGSRCVTRKRQPQTACTGGRTIDPQTGRCDCNGDSAWNGRACVVPNGQDNAQNNNNAQMKQAVCATLQIACSLGQKDACAKFNSGCP